MTSDATRYEKVIRMMTKTILFVLAAYSLLAIWNSNIPLLTGITITFYIIGTTLWALPSLYDFVMLLGYSDTQKSSHLNQPRTPSRSTSRRSEDSNP